MEKKNFNALEIEVVSFEQADIIRTSDGGRVNGDNEVTPDIDF